jgi:hypothetical protein
MNYIIAKILMIASILQKFLIYFMKILKNNHKKKYTFSNKFLILFWNTKISMNLTFITILKLKYFSFLIRN